MKRIVTILCLLSLLTMSNNSYGQVNSSIGQIPKRLEGSIFRSDLKLPPIALAVDSALVSVDLEDADNLREMFLPFRLNVSDAEGNITEEIHTNMGQRFTSPFAGNSSFVNTIRLFVDVRTLSATAANTMTVSLHKSKSQGTFRYPGDLIANSEKTVDLSELPLEAGEWTEIALPYDGFLTGSKDFWVLVHVTYDPDAAFEEQNVVGLLTQRADFDVQGDSYNAAIHRAVVGTDSGTWRGIVGFSNTEDPGYYANLAAVVEMTNGAVAGVAGYGVDAFGLSQNYPNPFNPGTEINYTTTERAPVTLRVYNAMGVEVAELVNEVQNAGPHSVNFDAKGLTSGNYYYTLTAGANRATKSMTLVK